MKSSILGCALMLNLGWLAACGGVSNIGSSDAGGSPNLGSGGFRTIGGGSKTGGASSTGMNPTAGSGPEEGNGMGAAPGTGMGGHSSVATGGSSSTGVECMADADCKNLDVACKPCASGGTSCNSFCKAGKCEFVLTDCPAKCNTDMDCPVDDGCIDCGGGTLACPTSTCLMGFCQASTPHCSSSDLCKGQPCGAPCKLCTQEGECPMGESFCDNSGQCVLGMTQCGGACMTKMDCGTPPPNCTPCSDGSCAIFDCIGGKCALSCPNSPQQCKYSEECSMLNTECSMCPNGKCAIAACIQSSCQLVCPVQ